MKNIQSVLYYFALFTILNNKNTKDLHDNEN